MDKTLFERKKASLYGQFLQKALYNDSPMLKSEELPSFSPFFVNWELINKINNNANQLITGRRGSGKTHVLGTFEEFINDKRDNNIAIRISIMDVISKMGTPDVIPDDPTFAAKKGAKALLENFLIIFFELFLDRITDYLDYYLKAKTEKKEYKAILKKTDDLLERLMFTIELGREYPLTKKAKKVLKKIKDKKGSLNGKAKIGLEAGQPSFDVGFSVEGKTGVAQEQESVIEVESLLRVDLYDVRKLILKILELSGINTLYILIDEWMEIDKITPSNKQAHFAQLLKQLFFNHKRLAVKISSVWHQTTLYDKKDMAQSVGMQLHHDIMTGLDLDTAFLLNEAEIISFCKELIFKRLSHICKEIRVMMRDNYIEDMFIEEIFDNARNFKTFVSASHGIPRDLMDLFHKCYLRIDRNFTKYCINYYVIAEESKNLYKIDKRKNIKPRSSAHQLLKIINQYLDKTERRLFIVEIEHAVRSNSLRKLIDEELIHQIPSAMTHRSIMDSYKAYHIDFGNYVDCITTKKKDIDILLNASVLPFFPKNFEAILESYVIDVAKVEDDILNCHNCDKMFSIAHPVYKKTLLCPNCAEEIK